jgi:CO dehydrogenase nickel-insertion accessory protein CooC1
MEKIIAVCGQGLIGKTVFSNDTAIVVVDNMQEVNQFDSTPTMAIHNYQLAYKNEIIKSGKELRRERRKQERKLKKSK